MIGWYYSVFLSSYISNSLYPSLHNLLCIISLFVCFLKNSPIYEIHEFWLFKVITAKLSVFLFVAVRPAHRHLCFFSSQRYIIFF